MTRHLERYIADGFNAQQQGNEKTYTGPQGYSIKEAAPEEQAAQMRDLPDAQPVPLTEKNLARLWEEMKKLLHERRLHFLAENCIPIVKSESEIYFALLFHGAEKMFELQHDYLLRNLKKRLETPQELKIWAALDEQKIAEKERSELTSEQEILEKVCEENPALREFLQSL